ncbi:hypothetical protein V6N13_087985 [Hibiscus sabdariffa]
MKGSGGPVLMIALVSGVLPHSVYLLVTRFRFFGFTVVPIDLFAVKVVLETFKKAGWASRSALTIELDNRVLINWLENTLQRPWSIAKYIAEIDSLVCGCVNVQFKLADILILAMAGSLALDGLSRTNWLDGIAPFCFVDSSCAVSSSKDGLSSGDGRKGHG